MFIYKYSGNWENSRRRSDCARSKLSFGFSCLWIWDVPLCVVYMLYTRVTQDG